MRTLYFTVTCTLCVLDFLCVCSTSVAIDGESKALVESENKRNATIIEVTDRSLKDEAKLQRGSALKQVGTFSFMQ